MSRSRIVSTLLPSGRSRIRVSFIGELINRAGRAVSPVPEVNLPLISSGQPRGNGGLMALCKDDRGVDAEPSLESNKILALLEGRSIQMFLKVVELMEVERRSRRAITKDASIDPVMYIKGNEMHRKAHCSVTYCKRKYVL